MHHIFTVLYYDMVKTFELTSEFKCVIVYSVYGGVLLVHAAVQERRTYECETMLKKEKK